MAQALFPLVVNALARQYVEIGEGTHPDHAGSPCCSEIHRRVVIRDIGRGSEAARGRCQELAADSTGQRNTFAELLSGRVEAKRLAWPRVQLSGNGIELKL
jgi:hypothetical protein